MKIAKELSERDKLYNAILRTVKENGAGLERGIVTAVLDEVSSRISMASGREKFDTIADMLNERVPRE